MRCLRGLWTKVVCLGLIGLMGCVAPGTRRVQVDPALAAQEARKQRELALAMLVDDWMRLHRVSYRILSGAVPLCADNTRAGIGMSFANKYSFGEDFADTALTLMHFSDVLQVTQVLPESPAERAGLHVGDLLVSFNGQSVPVGSDAAEDFGQSIETLKTGRTPAALKILREGKTLVTDIVPEATCGYSVGMMDDDMVNAFADGNHVVITRGMLRFTRDDTELGVVIGHELAHNANGHITAKRINAIPGFILDMAFAVIGVNTGGAFTQATANAFSQDFEAEADYVGLYMLALSGIDIQPAPNFWRRMATTHPGSIRTNHTASHPATPERFLALEQTVLEIRNKIAAGQPLVPEMKEGAPAETTGTPDKDCSPEIDSCG